MDGRRDKYIYIIFACHVNKIASMNQLDSVKNSYCRASTAITRVKGFMSNILLSKLYAESEIQLDSEKNSCCKASSADTGE